MPGRQLFIHVGPHKTGSTTIQRGLVANKEALLRQGYHYPEVAYVFDGHHNLVFDLADIDKYSEWFGGLDELVNFAATHEGNIILSSEAFDNIVTIEPLIKLKKAMGDGFDIHIIGYLRPQDELLQSLWKTEVRFDGLFENFDEWLPGALEKNKFLEYDHWIGVFEQAFGRSNIHFTIYDPKSDDLLFAFLKICGLKDFTEFSTPERENVSLPSLTFELVRRFYINPYIVRRCDKDGKIPIQKSSFANVAKIVRTFAEAENIDLSYSSYSLEMLKTVRDKYRPFNQAAARTYFERPALFRSENRLKAARIRLIDFLSTEQALNLGGQIVDMERESSKRGKAKAIPPSSSTDHD